MSEVSLNNNTGVQLEILPSALDINAEGHNDKPSALTNHSEARFNRLVDFLTKRTRKGNGCISVTKASRSTGSQNRYFRYSYRENGKQKTKSIPGGNIRAGLAQDRAKQIKEAILAGKSVGQILYLIGGFK